MLLGDAPISPVTNEQQLSTLMDGDWWASGAQLCSSSTSDFEKWLETGISFALQRTPGLQSG